MVIKADVQGSAEALADALSVLSTEHASVSVLRAGVGLVAPGDISLANTNDIDRGLSKSPIRCKCWEYSSNDGKDGMFFF